MSHTIEEQLKMLILEYYGSINAFSKASGIPYSTIANIFKRGVKSLGISTASRICECLCISLTGLANDVIVSPGDLTVSTVETQAERMQRTAIRAMSPERRARLKANFPELDTTNGFEPECSSSRIHLTRNEETLLEICRKLDETDQGCLIERGKVLLESEKYHTS